MLDHSKKYNMYKRNTIKGTERTLLLRDLKFTENIDQKIILLDYQNNFVRILKIMNNAAKNLNSFVLHNYFEFNKIIEVKEITFLICIQLKF